MIATSVISFCRAEPGPAMHADTMPRLALRPPPDFLSASYADSSTWPRIAPADESGRAWYMTWMGDGAGDGTGKSLSSTSPPIAHAAALAFLSDHQFMWAGFASRPKLCSRYDHVMSASLDHAFYLHDTTFDASGLLLYETDAPWSACGRTFVRGKLFAVDLSSGTGKLVASTVQEGVFRVKPNSRL